MYGRLQTHFPVNQIRLAVLVRDHFLSNIEPHLSIQPYLTNTCTRGRSKKESDF